MLCLCLSCIKFQNRRYHLGSFKTEEEALAAYAAAKQKFGIETSGEQT